MITHRYQICFSGSALKGGSAASAIKATAEAAREVVRRGHIVLTGATWNLPHAAAKAAKLVGGEHVTSIGFSPAASRLSHIKKYKLPIDAYDSILYTGFEYTGRNLFLVRSSDAVVVVGGRIGTLNELTIAIEEHKPIGVLLGTGGMAEEVERILQVAKRSRAGIFFADDPIALIDELVRRLDVKYRKLKQPTEPSGETVR